MDILALGYYKVTEWPPKPQELIDLDELLRSPQKRKEKHMDMLDVYKIKDRIMEDTAIKDYREHLSAIIALNYGNYDWLLQLKQSTKDLATLDKLESMLRDFRRVYWSGQVKNLPATRLIQTDYDEHVRTKRSNTTTELVDKLAETFGGTEIE